MRGEGPIVVTAIHDGHQLRPEVARIMALSEDERLREEDPFTGGWTSIGDTQIIGLRSRFEVDLNRPREKAVYINPEDAWGLDVWKSRPSDIIVKQSLSDYDAFYREAFNVFSELEKHYGHFVVFDLHSYNHHRLGPDKPYDSPELNPEVNLGTGTINMEKWGPLVNRFMNDLKTYNYNSGKLDVRENIKFRGGQFSRWIHENFPQAGCSISVEFKKFFMKEWTGKPDPKQLYLIKQALESTIPGVLEELKQMTEK